MNHVKKLLILLVGFAFIGSLQVVSAAPTQQEMAKQAEQYSSILSSREKGGLSGVKHKLCHKAKYAVPVVDACEVYKKLSKKTKLESTTMYSICDWAEANVDLITDSICEYCTKGLTEAATCAQCLMDSTATDDPTSCLKIARTLRSGI